MDGINEFRRIQESNQRLYIESSFSSLKEIGYECWIIRTYYPECLQHACIGMILFPLEIISLNDERKNEKILSE